MIFVDPANPGKPSFAALRRCCGQITGVVPKILSKWAEGVVLRLAYRLNRLWLIVEPTIWIEKPMPGSADLLKDFQRERQATRYNRHWNGLIEAWCETLTQGQEAKTLKAFGISEGMDAEFEIGKTSAFSRRLCKK